MQKRLALIAFGWLTLSGLLHFSIDVVGHAIQGRHPTGNEGTLYFGLHSAFALGQVVFGAFGLIASAQAPRTMGAPLFFLSTGAGVAWLAIAWLFIEYPQPRFATGVFLALIVASGLFHRR